MFSVSLATLFLEGSALNFSIQKICQMKAGQYKIHLTNPAKILKSPAFSICINDMSNSYCILLLGSPDGKTFQWSSCLYLWRWLPDCWPWASDLQFQWTLVRCPTLLQAGNQQCSIKILLWSTHYHSPCKTQRLIGASKWFSHTTSQWCVFNNSSLFGIKICQPSPVNCNIFSFYRKY